MSIPSDTQREKLLAALQSRGISAGKARVAARLLQDLVSYDGDEPANLSGAIESATLTYGVTLFARDTPDLVPDELQAAKDAGMTPRQYEEIKGVRSITDWNALQERRRAAGGAAT
jgi:hypothetical protein